MEEHLMTCYKCGAKASTETLEWCDCLTEAKTLVCPNCSSCFCKAPTQYRIEFWLNAPPSLHARKESLEKTDPAGDEQKPISPDRPLVLVVEDEMITRKVLCKYVAELGFNVIDAQNGVQGLEMAQQHIPDMVIADALMPRMDGREMCRLLKTNKDTAGIKVVITTATYTTLKYRNEGLRDFHADYYLMKPLKKNEIIEVINTALGSGARNAAIA